MIREGASLALWLVLLTTTHVHVLYMHVQACNLTSGHRLTTTVYAITF